MVYGVLQILENLWYTWVNEILRCTRGFIGFSGSLKTSGTLGRMRLLRVPEDLWVLQILEKPLVHLGE